MARKTTPTHVLLNQIELSSTTSSVTFSNIPSTYGDLVLVYGGNTTSSGAYDIRLKLNGDTSNYSAVVMYGTGSANGSFTQSSSNLVNLGSDARSTVVVQVMDYMATDKHKTSLIRADSSGTTSAVAQRWAITTAVSSLSFEIGAGVFVIGSTFSLYGVYA